MKRSAVSVCRGKANPAHFPWLGIYNLTEQLQTRLPVRLQPPENEVLAAFLARRWHVPIATTRMIAAGAGGNVRAAMADLEMWLG